MKKLLSLLLVLCLMASFVACGEETPAATTAAPTESTTEATEATTPWETGKEALNGKKVIFIGNSYTFCGYNVAYPFSTERTAKYLSLSLPAVDTTTAPG